MSDADLFRWAQTQMIWERAVAKERGTELPRIRGIRKLRANVHDYLTRSVVPADKRGRVAARKIERAVRRAYGLGIE